jgi:transcriptional regulator with XRE-family HTH domain
VPSKFIKQLGGTPIMILMGKAAKSVRESLGLNQKQAAEELGITNVHLCNIENDKVQLSTCLLERYREVFGVDLYVLAWCEQGDVNALPHCVRGAARKLQDKWKSEMKGRH